MTWYNPKTWFSDEEKENPAQRVIRDDYGSNIGTEATVTYAQAFDKLETVSRGVSMIVNAASSLDYDVKEKASTGISIGARQRSLTKLLNFEPNPYQSIQEFRTNIFTDFILEGNAFIYYDGVYMYHLPAVRVEIHTDPKTFVAGYTYGGETKFNADEILHLKDINSTSIYRGASRLQAADRNIKILWKMQKFQEQFFDNGAIPGLVLSTENTLSQVAKDKTIANWISKYSPMNGAKKPIIIDSGLKLEKMLQTTFQEMDFDVSIKTHDTKILKALGVPPILLDGGNNANISPNLRLFYLETVLPVVTKFVSAVERYFGYDVSPVTTNVSALQPELKDVAAYYTTLVNGGVITPNEARVELRYDKDKDPNSDKLRVPANIAGSASDPSTGGAPKKPSSASTQ